MKKFIAMAIMLSMAFSLTACSGGTSGGETSTADNSVADTSAAADSSEEGSNESSKEDTKEESKEVSTDSASFTEFENITTKHEPYGISVDYQLPKLDGYEMKPSTGNPNYFGTFVEDSYYYRKDGKTNGIDVYLKLHTFNAEDAKKNLSGKEEYTNVTSDNGNQITYKIKVKDEGTDKAAWETYMDVYGGTYRDCNLYAPIHFLAAQSDMTKEEFEAFIMAVANSVKFSVENENALITGDGSFNLYSHNLIVAPKVKVAGNEYDTSFYFKRFYPMAKVEFNDNDIKYEIETEILTYNSMLWENSKKKGDEYTALKIAGYDALGKLQSFGASGELIIQLNENHVEKINVSAVSFADGSKNKDGVSFYDLQKEMMDDSHKAETLKKFASYADGFVSKWVLNEQ